MGEPHEWRTTWAFCAEKAADAEPKWRPPVFVGYGVALNEPLVLSGGGVHSDREPILLIEAYEQKQEAKRKK